jgi:hypothetical protein
MIKRRSERWQSTLRAMAVAGALAAIVAVPSAAHAQLPDPPNPPLLPGVRLLFYDIATTASCNVGCSQLTINFALAGLQANDELGNPVPAAIRSKPGFLEAVKFEFTPTLITGVQSFSPSGYTTVFDVNDFLVLDANTPLIGRSFSAVLNVTGLAPTSVLVGGVAFLGANREFFDANGNVIPLPSLTGPTYQWAGFNQVVDLTRPGGPGTVVPEPSTIVLLGSGLLAIGGVLRRRRSRAAA